jgi:hypothetical protein
VTTPITTKLRTRPEIVFWCYGLNVAIYAGLLLAGARGKIILLGAIFSAAALGFVYLCLKGGFVLSPGKKITAEGEPRDFWLSMIICYGIYLVGTFFAVLLHFQDLYRAGLFP